MARQRTVKPEFFQDKVIARQGSQVAVVYQALWCWADDGGVARIEPDLVKGEAFARWPEYTISVITDCLVRLHSARRIRPYVVGEELFAEIPTLARHSPANHPSRFRHPRDGQEVEDIRAWLTGQLSLRPQVALRDGFTPTATATATSTTTAEAAAAARSRNVKPESAASPAPVALTYAMTCVVAANGALDRLTAGGYKPLVADVEAPTAEAWERDGVPLPVAKAAIRDAVTRYRVTPRDRHPRSLRYFDGAVRDAWEKSRANGAKPRPVTDQPKPSEPSYEEQMAEFDRRDQLIAARAATPRPRRGNIGAIPLPAPAAA